MNFSDLGKISIVDDDESIRTATKALLRSVGYEVETFASAELFLESDALRVTDCLVLDLRMPGIDGLELQRRLNETQSRVPIIFVTAHDDRSHRTIAMDAGAANFFRKPFEANAFVSAVKAALGSGRSPEVSSKPEETDALLAVRSMSSLRSDRLSEQSGQRKVRIVLVDDNPGDVSLLRLALDDAEVNCELTVIDDGAEALAFVRQQGKYAHRPIPDLAVLDLNLPKNDGLQILEAMSENRALTGVPVVILSSGLSPRDLAKIQEFNLARYITKPSTLEEFLKIGLSLKALLEHGSAGRSSGAMCDGYV